MIEEWRPIPGCDGNYEVSDQGRVRSVDRVLYSIRRGKVWAQRRRGKILRPQLDRKTGYVRVFLGEKRRESIQRLVLLTFVGPCPDGHEAAHGDGVRIHNVLSNLRWATTIDNHADRRLHGTVLQGEAHPMAKLTAAQAADIRKLRGIRRQADIAMDYAISIESVRAIHQGRLWKHV